MARWGAVGNQTGEELRPYHPHNPNFQERKPRLSQVTDLSRVMYLVSDRAALIPSLLTPCPGSFCCASAATSGKEPVEREGQGCQGRKAEQERETSGSRTQVEDLAQQTWPWIL